MSVGGVVWGGFVLMHASSKAVVPHTKSYYTGSQNRQTVREGKLSLGEALNLVLVVALLKLILAGKYEWN